MLTRKIFHRFLSIFFHYLYYEMAWTYDHVASIVSLGRWKDWTKTSLAFLNGKKILELGHGPGHLIFELTLSGKHAFGIDLSPYMGRLTSARLKDRDLPVTISTADAQHLPFKAEEFDQVVATFPTEYILNERTLFEIFRVLRSNGSLIVVPAAWITGTTFFDRAASWLFHITGQSPQWDDKVLEPAHAAGFQVSTERITLRSSEVLIVIAKKIHKMKSS